MKSFKHTLAFVACTVTASMSYAGPTVHVDFDRNIFEGSAYSTTKISASSLTPITVYAGRFQGTASQIQGVPASIFVDSPDNLFMYCYDIYQHIYGGAKVDYTINLSGETARTLDFLGAVNTVLSVGKPAYDPFAWLHSSLIRDPGVAAAIQIGIWESKYETNSDWDLSLGSFKATDLDTDTGKWWNKFKGVIGSSDSLDAKYVMVLENKDYQDMITGDPIPEPGSLALLGLGLSGLAFAKRKKAKR